MDLNKLKFNEMKIKLKELNPGSYLHCLSTMEEAEKLALHYGLDTGKAKIAGLLHDCGKMKKGKDNLTHSKLGAQLAKEIFNIQDIEILDAIMYHTTGRENMTLLGKIIFIADKIEPRRKYDGVDSLRKAAYENIDDAIIMSLERTIEYVKMRNLELDNESIKTLEFLKEVK
ncbi:MAG: bis(5'-nucleosyl)-tetraphosphatase (symmetrical) YqeK [Sedimentibacter sp.]